MSNTTSESHSSEVTGTDRGGFCGALQRAPPPMPAALNRRLANKENTGLGKVSCYSLYLFYTIVDRISQRFLFILIVRSLQTTKYLFSLFFFNFRFVFLYFYVLLISYRIVTPYR